MLKIYDFLASLSHVISFLMALLSTMSYSMFIHHNMIAQPFSCIRKYEKNLRSE